MSNVIFLKGQGLIKEALASGAIQPGHRLDLTVVTGNQTVAAGAAGAAADGGRRAFAVENPEIGRGIDNAYADGEQVKYVLAVPGDEVQARAATGLTWAAGAPLYSAAAGQVTDVPGTAVTPIGYALDARTTTAANELVPMEVA